MSWKCPKCGSESTTIIRHEKWEVELFCMNCEEFIVEPKRNKLKLERANPGLFDGEEW